MRNLLRVFVGTVLCLQTLAGCRTLHSRKRTASAPPVAARQPAASGELAIGRAGYEQRAADPLGGEDNAASLNSGNSSSSGSAPDSGRLAARSIRSGPC